MTALELLVRELWECKKTKSNWKILENQAKEMQKKQLLDFGSKVAMKAHSGLSGWSIEQLYNETFEK
jgi:hypothetical protein